MVSQGDLSRDLDPAGAMNATSAVGRRLGKRADFLECILVKSVRGEVSCPAACIRRQAVRQDEWRHIMAVRWAIRPCLARQGPFRGCVVNGVNRIEIRAMFQCLAPNRAAPVYVPVREGSSHQGMWTDTRYPHAIKRWNRLICALSCRGRTSRLRPRLVRGTDEHLGVR